METFIQDFIRFLFFPLTLSGSLGFLGILAWSEFSGVDREEWRGFEEHARLSTLGILFPMLVGLWVAFVIYLSIIGLTHIFGYPFPSFSIFLINFLICSSISFSVPPILPHFYNAILLGFIESLLGGLAHTGFSYLYSLPGHPLGKIPALPVILFGVIIGLTLRNMWFIYKGA